MMLLRRQQYCAAYSMLYFACLRHTGLLFRPVMGRSPGGILDYGRVAYILTQFTPELSSVYIFNLFPAVLLLNTIAVLHAISPHILTLEPCYDPFFSG